MKVKLNEQANKTEFHLEEKKLEAGIFGKLFGTGSNALNNITGMLVIILILALIFAWLINPVEESLKFIEIVIPIITLALGYLFGKQPSK